MIPGNMRRTASVDNLNMTELFASFSTVDGGEAPQRLAPNRAVEHRMPARMLHAERTQPQSLSETQSQLLNNNSRCFSVEYLGDILPLNHYRNGYARRQACDERPAHYSPIAYGRPPPPGEDLLIVDGNMNIIGGRDSLRRVDEQEIITSTPLESPVSSTKFRRSPNKVPLNACANSKIFSETATISVICTDDDDVHNQEDHRVGGNSNNPCSVKDYENQYHRLNRLMELQKEQIEQARSALNQCRKQHRSNGTLAELSAQRTLLLATERLRILHQELELLSAQQIATTGSLKPFTPSLCGSMTISTIRIYLNRSFCIKSVDNDTSYDFVVLLKSGENVYATQVSTVMDIGAIRARTVRFPDTVRFSNLTVDFTISVEVFAMKIENRSSNAKNSCISKRTLACLNPLSPRSKKLDLDSAVNGQAFGRCGHVCLNKDTTGNLKLYVDDAEYPLEGTIEMRADCSLLSSAIEIEYEGYLSMYEVIKTESTWSRYWTVLRQGVIKFWRCSNDEAAGKLAVAFMDLSKVTNDIVTTCPVEVCSRPNTFYIDLFTQSSSFNQQIAKPVYSLKRVLLNADTKVLCDAWMLSLNETISLLRANAKAKP